MLEAFAVDEGRTVGVLREGSRCRFHLRANSCLVIALDYAPYASGMSEHATTGSTPDVPCLQASSVDLPPRLRLAFDLAYGESESQLKSLGRQLSMVYGLMRKTAMGEDGPLPSVHLTSATPEVRRLSVDIILTLHDT